MEMKTRNVAVLFPATQEVLQQKSCQINLDQSGINTKIQREYVPLRE